VEFFDPKTEQFGGRVFKNTGDGALAEFGSAVDAVQCAVEIQRVMAQRNSSVPENRRIVLRIGINLGDVIIEGDDIHGGGVNVAARLEGLCEPGTIYVSGSVFDQVAGKLDVAFDDLGDQTVKNISKPVRVYRARGETGDQAAHGGMSGVAPLPGKPSVAVLAFDNMSGDPEQEYFADGIAEDIATSLSKLSQLLVIARNSSFTYKGRAVKVQDIGQELGVRHVIEGSVRKSGNRVRITAQLIDCVTGGHLWAERFDRELTDIFEVQDEVTREIVSAMAVTLTADERERLKTTGPDNLEAYDYFLRGRDQYRLLSRESNARADVLLKRAIDIAPEYSSAHAYLVFTHLADYFNQWKEDSDRSLERAFDSARRAVEADDTDPYAHLALGKVHMWSRRHEDAIAEHERTVELDPNFAVAYAGLGLVLHYTGRPEEAIKLIERGMRLDPHYPDMRLHWLAQPYFQLGRYEKAVELLEQLLSRKPDTDVSRVLLASSYGHLGRKDKAGVEWAEALRINPGYSLEHRRKILPYKDPDDFEQIVSGLRKAGLLEP
jgi:TolB-like protein/lipoprotein NlpI